MKKIDVVVEKTSNGYAAYASELNVFTTAEDVPGLYSNLNDALNLYYEDEGRIITGRDINLSINFQQFFQHYRVLNAKFLAERIGMNASLLSQYVRGKKQPSKKQAQRILEGIREIGAELASLRFD